MTSVRNSLALSFASKYTTLVLTIAGTMVIARLLTPAEIGTYAVGAVVIGIAQTFRSFGVGSYLIQEKELNDTKIRAAFMVTLVMAWIMGAIAFGLAPWAGRFYDEPGVHEVIMVMAISLFLIPFGSITLNLLRRQMEFGKIYWINTATAVVYFLSSVGLAWYGFGFMSLAWAAVISVIMTITMCLLYRPKEVPLLPGVKGISNVLNFGFYLLGANLSKEGHTSLPDLVIGKVMSMDAVGYFGKANGAVQMFGRLVTSAILPVILPHFSQLRRGGENSTKTYLKTLSYITVLAWPFFAFMACMAEPIILILFGPQWEAAVPVARILAFYGMLQSAFSLAESLYVSHGKVANYFHVRLAILVIHGTVILVTASNGLEAIAAGFIFSGLASLVIVMLSLRSTLGVGIRQTIGATYKGVIVALFTAIVPLAVTLDLVTIDGLFLPLLLAAAGAMIGWLLGLWLTRHVIVQELRRLLDNVSKRRTHWK